MKISLNMVKLMTAFSLSSKGLWKVPEGYEEGPEQNDKPYPIFYNWREHIMIYILLLENIG